jgi:hypothetical protein
VHLEFSMKVIHFIIFYFHFIFQFCPFQESDQERQNGNLANLESSFEANNEIKALDYIYKVNIHFFYNFIYHLII